MGIGLQMLIVELEAGVGRQLPVLLWVEVPLDVAVFVR